MNRYKKKNSGNDGFIDFINGFNEVLSVFQSGTESVLNIVTGSFEKAGRHSETISALFGLAKSDVQDIFAFFSGIASLFTGGRGGGLLGSLFELIPGGEFITAIFGSALNTSSLPPLVNQPPQTSGSTIGTIYVPALPKEGYYKIHKTGKEMAELRPAK